MNFGRAGAVTCGNNVGGKGDEQCLISPPQRCPPSGKKMNMSIKSVNAKRNGI